MEASNIGSPSMRSDKTPLPGSVKLFVGGLTGSMTRELLAAYFSDYAEVIDSFVVYEGLKPAGFGFVTVRDKRDADKILQAEHSLNGSLLDVKPALDRAQAKSKEESERRRKVFVGGLPKNFCDESLKIYFEAIGPVQKCYVVKDTVTGKTRGFGFVIFSTDEGFKKALENPNLTIEGNAVHVKAATSKQEQTTSKASALQSSPSPKKSRKPRRHQQEKREEESPEAADQSPVNYSQTQFHFRNASYQDEYDPQSPYNGSYYVDPRKQHQIPAYLSYQTNVYPQQPPVYYGQPYQYPYYPVQSAVHMIPSPVNTIGQPIHGSMAPRLQVHSNRQIYPPVVVKPQPVKALLHKQVLSTQALQHRPGGESGSMVYSLNTLVSGQSAMPNAKSAHFIGFQPRAFLQSEYGHPRPTPPAGPQTIKYVNNPFGVHDDEEEVMPDGLKRAGDF